jgi:chromosomal replication initiator protein
MTAIAVTEDIWLNLLKEFQRSLSPDIYKTWFEPVKSSVGNDGSIVLITPNEFAAIWLEDNYLDLIRERSFRSIGERLNFKVVSEASHHGTGRLDSGECANEPKETTAANRSDRGASESLARGGSSFVRGNSKNSKARTYLNPRNTFNNFIVGSSNQLAHAAATAVAASPGNAYNPLFIYGDTGLGKTHLMHAIAHTIQSTHPDANVVYLSCEKFTNKFLTAIRENTLEAFRRFYRKVDVLLIDDIQFLEGKERTQEEFFHTFNELFETQRQLCLSSDRPASEISKLESRLVSRFQWGMVTDIQAPDLETRVAILKKKLNSMGQVTLPDNVLEFLASRVTRNVRRLEGALIKVATYARLMNKPLDVRVAENLIRDILQEESQNQITIERVQKKVTEYFDLRMSDMLSRRRPNNIAFPRQIAMYLSRILTCQPLKEIGEAFGGRDHGTVIHACKTVENIMEQDESVRRNVEYLTRQLNGQYH